MNRRILNGLALSVTIAFVTFVVGTFTISTALKSKIFLGDSQPAYVVNVTVAYNTLDQEQDQGTGTLIRSDLVLTCHHVVRDARPGDRVFVTFKHGMEREALVIKTDKDLDLAVLRIDPVITAAARASRKAAIKNQEVVIGGFPTVDKYQEIRGRVAGFRDATRNSPGKELFIVSQRSAGMSGGMSGGPVFNMGGEVVGVLFGNLRYAHCTGLEAIKTFMKGVK